MNDTTSIFQERRIPLFSALLGVGIASWILFLHNGYIDNDGLLYIEVAKQFSLGAWQQGFSLYNWPFYSLLIAIIHKITGLDLLDAAHTITICSFAILTAGLPVLVRELGGNHRTQLASVLLLIGSTPLVGNYLPMALRDHGFLSAHLWSLIFLLRFCRNNRIHNSLGWNMTATLATLFRIEGIIYFAILPILAVPRKNYSLKENIFILIKANIFFITAITIIILAFFLIPNLELQRLGRLGDPITMLKALFQQLSGGLEQKANSYGELVLGPFLDDYAMWGLVLTLLFVLIVKSLNSVGLAQLLFAISALKKINDLHLSKRCLYFLSILAIINIIDALCILFVGFTLPKRYLQPLGLVIIVLAAFGSTIMFDHWQRATSKRWVFPTFTAILILQIALNFKPTDPRNLIDQNAANWINTNLPTNSMIYYDYGKTRYYVNGDSSSRKKVLWNEIEQLLDSGDIKNYDYIVIHLTKKERYHQEELTQRFGDPLAVFEDTRGKRLLIYRISR